MGIIKFNNVPSTTPGLEVETFPNYVAPEKEYQVTHVPGRNGDLVVDTKTYKNVPRSYKVSMAVEPPAVSVSGSTASFEATAERALAECKTAISSDVGKTGTTIINSATDPVENNEPYNFRAVPNGVGDRENDTLIGGTVAWNQHATGSGSVNNCSKSYDAQTNTITITPTNYSSDFVGVYGLSDGAERTANHKIFVSIDVFPDNNGDFKIGYGADITKSATASKWNTLSAISSYASGTLTVYLKSGSSGWSSGTYKIKNVIAVDLTQMFGSTIADYIYGLETATAGAGVAWFRNLFPKDYYAYNAGELISVKTEAHKTTGKNLVKYTIPRSTIGNDGVIATHSSTNFDMHIARIIKGTTYTIKSDESVGVDRQFVGGFFYNFPEIGSVSYNGARLANTPATFVAPIDGYVAFRTSLNYSIAQCEFGSNQTPYEPYEERIYPLNPALELRGIPKLNSSNKLYYDGDIYSSDGSVIRKYGIVDLGLLIWRKEGTYPEFRARYVDNPTIQVGAYNGGGVMSNCFCSKYEAKTPNQTYHGINKGVSMADGYISIGDSDYSSSTADAFKTAMSGVYLIYELATPVIESTTGLIDNVSIASFDDGADNQSVNNLEVEIMAIESGSGEKSPTNPYTISGFDSGVVTRCGKNWFNDTVGTHTINANTDRTIVVGDVWLKANQTYVISCKQTPNAVSSFTRNILLVVGNGQTVYNPAGNDYTIKPMVFTPAASGIYNIRLWGHTLPVDTDYTEFQVELGNTPSDYHAYNGNTYTFTFGQTVYGGHFNNKGNLVVTHIIKKINEISWTYRTVSGISGYIFLSNEITGIKQGQSPIMASIYEIKVNRNFIDGNYQVSISNNTTAFDIIVKDDDFTDVSGFLSSRGNETFLFELATPITLSITSQDIPMLLGKNNIFANTGNIKTLSYPKQVCPFEPAQEVDDHGTEEYIDNREVAIPVGHESKYFTAGKIYNFSWLDEAGLIKEGELNADTGVLTITNGYKVIDIGDLTWNYNVSRVAFDTVISGLKPISAGTIGNMSCSAYAISAAISSSSDVTNKPDMTICQGKNNEYVFIKNSSFTDAATFKSAMHGVKLLYELADPVRTIQLTPVQVESLIGHNVLISESGNISVTPRTYSTYTEKMNAISDWLHSASGYARLEDTYEPDYYRKAYYDEQTDMENIFDEAGRATLKFVCKPQRYLKSGEEPITISSGVLIQNRTRYEAYPILKVTTNNTQGSVAIGNHSITIKAGAGTDPITIDCELQDAWSGTSNKNSYIVLTDGEFPVIDPGTQTVTFDGGVQSVEVIPRWWTV